MAKKQDKTIFFMPGAYDGCYLYRGYYPGVNSGCLIADDFIGKKFDVAKMKDKALAADIVVVQRPNEPVRAQLAVLLKGRGKKIIFDNDDTYLPDVGVPLNMLPSQEQRDIAIRMNEYLYATLKIADGATASTEFLAKEFRKINPNVVVTKNCIDPLDEYPVVKNTTGKFRILFAGSVVSNDDYTHIKDDIRKLDERGDVTIIVFGIKQPDGSIQGAYKEDFEFWSSLKNIEWHNYVPVNEYMYTISKMAPDVAVIPRKDSYFNRCKSNVKFLEMSLLRIPVVAQGFKDGQSPYQQNGEDELMTVVVDNKAWYKTIIKVKSNYEQYKKLADKAHDYTVKNYNIREYAKEWKNILLKLAK